MSDSIIIYSVLSGLIFGGLSIAIFLKNVNGAICSEFASDLLGMKFKRVIKKLSSLYRVRR